MKPSRHDATPAPAEPAGASAGSPGPHLLVFDLYSSGHHLQHLQQLTSYWVRHALPGRLDIAVPHRFLRLHPSLPAFIERHPQAGIRLLAIPHADDLEEPHALSLIRNDLVHGRLLRHYATLLRPDHCLAMYFDHMQLSLACGLRFDFPVRISGLYFRPSFHYGRFEARPAGLAEQLRRRRKATLLRAALRNPHFKYLFCLDPFVVPHVPTHHDVAAVPVPDGISTEAAAHPPGTVRMRMGVAAGRKMLLLFGALDSRKGVFNVIEALHLLPEAEQHAVSLVLAGVVTPGEKAPLREALQRLEAQTSVQVVLEDRFLEAAEIPDLVGAADLMLLPYQKHIGSSGVLVRAAAAGVPVLGSDYGLLGEHIRRRGLGLCVDAAAPQAIADGLAAFLRRPEAMRFDAAEARRFAQENTAELYAATLFRHLGVPIEDPVSSEHPTDAPAS